MSQQMRYEKSGNRERSRTATESNDQKNFEGFEGMNYEQVRQPYNPKYKGRNSGNDQRNESKRPDEA